MRKTTRLNGDSLDSFLSQLPLLWLSLAFLLGILLAGKIQASTWLWLILAGGALALAGMARLLLPRLGIQPFGLPHPMLFLLTLCLTALFIGAARYQLTTPKVDAHAIAWYNDRQYEVLVTGIVAEPPDERDSYTNLRVNVTAVDIGEGDLPVRGLILARVDPGGELHYGDGVRLRGHLQTPPESEDFTYRDYLDRQGIRTYMPDAGITRLPFEGGSFLLRAVYAFKDHCVANITRIFTDPEAALLSGILLGEDNGLTAPLQQAFKNTGTAHIIAIPSFNIVIIAGLFVTVLCRRLGSRRGAVAAASGIAVYTVLLGADPSAVRAAIIGGLALFALQVGRRQTALNTLAFTAAAMAVFDPLILWDAGFQLSCGATLGLVLYAVPFKDWFTGLLARRLPSMAARKIAAPVGVYVLFTLAAQLTALPIMAYHFQRFSLISLLAGPFILPAQPAVVILGGLAVLFSFVALPIGQLFAWIAWPFLAYTIRTVEFFDRLPHGVVVLGEFSLVFALLFYALLLAVTFAGPRLKPILRLALAPAVILVTLGSLTFLVWSAVFASPDGRLRLTFLDVGSADAVLIQTPSGRSVLVDGGPSLAKLSDALGRRLSPFDRRLDWLVVASTQEQQLAALPLLLDRYPPGDVLWSGGVGSSYAAGQLDSWLAGNGIPVTRADPGAALDLGEGAALKVLTASPRGAVLLVEWNDFRALLPIGINIDVLAELENGKAVGPVTVLLLADSGDGPSNPPEWIANLHPQLVVLSVAAGDPNGLPDQAVLEAVTGVTLLRTDRDGWIEVATDGTKMWVEVGKK